MKVGFTGTQQGMTARQKSRVCDWLTRLNCTEFHHGDCVGADEEADNIARTMGIAIAIHPPDNPSKRANCHLRGPCVVLPGKPYLVRNKDIVNDTEQMLVAPKERAEQIRSGTWSTFRFAVKTRKPGLLLLP